MTHVMTLGHYYFVCVYIYNAALSLLLQVCEQSALSVCV